MPQLWPPTLPSLLPSARDNFSLVVFLCLLFRPQKKIAAKVVETAKNFKQGLSKDEKDTLLKAKPIPSPHGADADRGLAKGLEKDGLPLSKEGSQPSQKNGGGA